MPAWAVARAQTLAEWRDWSPFAGLQIPYSLTQREAERDLLPMAGHLGLSVAAWSPLAGGVLSGKFTRGGAADGTRVKPQNISERDLTVARAVDAVADRLGWSSSQVALAWTRAHRPDVHPIVGARRLDQLADNLAAADLRLPEDEVRILDEASAIEVGFPHDFITSTRDFVYGTPTVAATVRR
jgi:aryl-alcohol dehydrogenase-like predicted oxidoreductase